MTIAYKNTIGKEKQDSPNSQAYFEFLPTICWIPISKFFNTTAYRLSQFYPTSPTTKELVEYVLLKQYAKELSGSATQTTQNQFLALTMPQIFWLKFAQNALRAFKESLGELE